MKISELKNGFAFVMNLYGRIKIIEVHKNYMVFQQIGGTEGRFKMVFASPDAPISDLGITAQLQYCDGCGHLLDTDEQELCDDCQADQDSFNNCEGKAR
jgi:hypothetical protein